MQLHNMTAIQPCNTIFGTFNESILVPFHHTLSIYSPSKTNAPSKITDKSRTKIIVKNIDKSKNKEAAIDNSKEIDKSKEVQKTTTKNGLPWWMPVLAILVVVAIILRKFRNIKPFG
jgi:stringent starvation protein B